MLKKFRTILFFLALVLLTDIPGVSGSNIHIAAGDHMRTLGDAIGNERGRTKLIADDELVLARVEVESTNRLH